MVGCDGSWAGGMKGRYGRWCVGLKLGSGVDVASHVPELLCSSRSHRLSW